MLASLLGTVTVLHSNSKSGSLLDLHNSKQKGLLEVHCTWKSSCQNLSMQISDFGLCFYWIQIELSGIFRKALSVNLI